MLKMAFFPFLRNVLDAQRSKTERENIMQQMFDQLKQILKEDTELLKFEDLQYYHMMVVRKKCDKITSI